MMFLFALWLFLLLFCFRFYLRYPPVLALFLGWKVLGKNEGMDYDTLLAMG
jgi:hypothetical protein